MNKKRNKEDLNTCRNIPTSCFGILNLTEKVIFSNSVCNFQRFPFEIPAGILFVQVNKAIIKCTLNYKWPRLVETILENKHTIGGLTQPDFKTHCNATIIKPPW